MARHLKVEFPIGGQNRRLGYAQKTRPFSTPKAKNVRSVGPLERRGRGGSRPGLSKVIDNDYGTNITGLAPLSYVDTDGTHQYKLAVIADGNLFLTDGSTTAQVYSYWVTDDGDQIITDDGDNITFNATVASVNPGGTNNSFQMAQLNGALYIADATLSRYRGRTGDVTLITDAPASQPLVAAYQQRIWLTGLTNVYYACRMDDDDDWNFADDMGDVARAFAGQLGDEEIGDTPTAMLTHKNKALVMGTADTLWAFYGNPAGNGVKKNVSEHLGIVTADARCTTPDGLMLFIARDGLYMWQIGSDSHPTPYSPNVVPKEFRDISTTAVDISMAYDVRNRGVHIFLTPLASSVVSGVGTHWWLDLENKAMWPVVLPEAMQPYVATTMQTSGDSNVVLGCSDGYVRRFAASATDDDGTDITSDILLGPFHVPRMEGFDGQVKELVGALAQGSGEVTWSIITGSSAEAAVDLAADMVDNQAPDVSVLSATGTWMAGQNRVAYPRARGPWAVVRLTSTNQWSYSTLSMVVDKLGRLRNG